MGTGNLPVLSGHKPDDCRANAGDCCNGWEENDGRLKSIEFCRESWNLALWNWLKPNLEIYILWNIYITMKYLSSLFFLIFNMILSVVDN